MPLSLNERDSLEDTDFAVPETRDLPIHDRIHVGMAWKIVDRIKGLSASQRSGARTKILRKAHDLNMDTSKWHLQPVSFSAMSIEFPKAPEEHPNKVPFSGVLTRLDQPSDKPLNGTNGKCVILPSAVAEDAIYSLLGMGIDFSPNFDKHRPRSKIGLITAAEVVGNAIEISGFFYAADFPEEVQTIQAEQEKLGFSFEAQSLMLNMKSDPLIVEACKFTGAAVLYKDKAAYYDTSIAANADQENEMTKEQEEQLAALAAGQKGVAAALDKIAAASSPEAIAAAVDAAIKKSGVSVAAASVLPLVKPHAAALRNCASAMMAAGIGCHASAGHAAYLNKMADTMEAQAIMGQVPNTFDSYMHASADAAGPKVDIDDIVKKVSAGFDAALKPVVDSVGALDTKFKDLAVKVAASGEPPKNTGPARKTIDGTTMATLKRLGIDASAEAGLSVATVDAAARKAGLPMQASAALKLALKEAGALAAV